MEPGVQDAGDEVFLAPFLSEEFREDLEGLVESGREASRRFAADAVLLSRLAGRVPRLPGDERGGTSWTSFLREVAVARRCSDRAAASDVALAVRLVSLLPRALGLLQAGELPVSRARALVESTYGASDGTASRIDAEVAERACRLTPSRVRDAAQKVLLREEADAVAARAAAATASRQVRRSALQDDQAEIALVGPAVPLQQAMDALDHDARALRAAGDGRGLDALRFDLATSRLRGDCPGACPGSSSPVRPMPPDGSDSGPQHSDEAPTDGPGQGADLDDTCPAAPSPCTCPPGQDDVVHLPRAAEATDLADLDSSPNVADLNGTNGTNGTDCTDCTDCTDGTACSADPTHVHGPAKPTAPEASTPPLCVCAPAPTSAATPAPAAAATPASTPTATLAAAAAAAAMTATAPAASSPTPTRPAVLAPPDTGSPSWLTDRRCSRPVRLNITVPVTTALGLSDEPGWLDGHGWISAPTCRQLLPAAELRQVCTDSRSGRVVDLAEQVVRPAPDPASMSAALRDMASRPFDITDTAWLQQQQHDPSDQLSEFVVLRDELCDGPTGARVSARRADLDHDRAHPEGPTAAWNLVARSRRTHVLKHRGWTPVRTLTGTLWFSPAGQLVEVPFHAQPLEPLETEAVLPDPVALHDLEAELLRPPTQDDAPPDW